MRSSPSPIQILKSSVELKNPKKNQGSKFQYFTRIVAIVGKAMRRARAANKDSFMVLHNLLPRLQFGAKNPRRRHQRCKMLSCIRTVRVRSIFESQKYYHGASELLASNINPNLSHYHHGEIGLPVHLTHYNDTGIIPITIFAPFLLKNNIFGIELCLNWSVTAVWPPLSSIFIHHPKTYLHTLKDTLGAWVAVSQGGQRAKTTVLDCGNSQCSNGHIDWQVCGQIWRTKGLKQFVNPFNASSNPIFLYNCGRRGLFPVSDCMTSSFIEQQLWIGVSLSVYLCEYQINLNNGGSISGGCVSSRIYPNDKT